MIMVNDNFEPWTLDQKNFGLRFRVPILLCFCLTLLCGLSTVQSDDTEPSDHVEKPVVDSNSNENIDKESMSSPPDSTTTTSKPEFIEDDVARSSATRTSPLENDEGKADKRHGKVALTHITTAGPEISSTSTSKRTTTRAPSKIEPTLFTKSGTEQAATTRQPQKDTGQTTTKPRLIPTISDKNIVVEERDVSYFLEGHLGHNIHDARSFFTDERVSRALFIAMNDLCEYPDKLRFAYLVRLFIEMGRKVASRANLLVADIIGLLKRMPDDLGNKPDTSMMMDVIATSFDSKSERQTPDTNKTIAELIDNDEDKKRVYKSSLDKTSQYIANILSYVAYNVSKTCLKSLSVDKSSDLQELSLVLSESIRKGSNQMLNELKSLDKFALSSDAQLLMNQVVDKITEIIKSDLTSREKTRETLVQEKIDQINLKLADLNHLSDLGGLVGSWHNYLFSNLGSAERVVKLLSSLLHRVPNHLKSSWLNMYSHSAMNEMRRTLPSFVSMQTYPYKKNYSETIFLNPSKEARLLPSKMDELRKDYSLDKERLPARCYLAGRRWRLLIARALRDYPQMSDVIKKIADNVSKWRSEILKVDANDINYKLCLPKLEVGLLGWGINGDPQESEQAKTQFPFKNPLGRLTTLKDPFHNGYRLGYKLGFEVGYNEERNASLEIDVFNKKGDQRDQKQPQMVQNLSQSSNQSFQQDPRGSNSNSLPTVEYVSRLSYRKACSASAKRVFPIALEEGYLSCMKISLNAGLRIVSDSGSIVGAIRGKTFGSQEGRQVGRMTADSVILNANSVPEGLQKNLTTEGESQGLVAGTNMGTMIGALAGQEGAIEAYLQTVLSGGQLRFARFHMQEYIRGARLGFDYGLDVGKRVASSSDLDPSAPAQLKHSRPESGKFNNDLSNSWMDLMPAINDTVIDAARYDAHHILIDGRLKGKYHFRKEVKRGLTRVSLTNQTQNVEVDLHGFIHNDIAYLNINGSIDNQGQLRGTVAAARILNLKDWQ